MTQAVVEIVFLALAISAISLTTSSSSVFESTRNWLDDKSYWLGKLAHCYYCTSHWLSFAAVAYYQPRIIHSQILIIDLAVSAFAIICISAFVSGIIFKLVFSHRYEEDINELKNLLIKAKEKILELQKAQED